MGGPTSLIGVDWGTSSLRAYRIGRDGRIHDRRSSARGIMQVEQGRFDAVLRETIGDWRTPALPVILSGMIGSRQGWIEAPYLPTPTGLDDLAAGLLRHPEDPLIHIVPGLARRQADAAPDVMRGEETQIQGAIGDLPGRRLLVMPGTHSKWVLADGGRINWFATFMTGEVFAVLKDHSILGRLMEGERHDDAAFARGLKAAGGPAGLLQLLFSVRTLGLFSELPGSHLAAYLSGLLIGSEVAEASRELQPAEVMVIGSSPLADRYIQAIEAAGLKGVRCPDDAAARGQYLLARAAGLITETSSGAVA